MELTDADLGVHLQVALNERENAKRDFLAAEMRWNALPEDQKLDNHPEQNTMAAAQERYDAATAKIREIAQEAAK